MVCGRKKIIKYLLFLFLFLNFFELAKAADLYLSPAYKLVQVGENFSLNVLVDSSDQSANAVSFRINYPSNLLKINSLSQTNSLINFFVQQPNFSESEIYAEGVIMNPGFWGSAGKILTINFKALKPGSALINFLSGSVLANDGAGTNILKNLKSANIEIKEAPKLEQKPKQIGNPPMEPKVFSETHPNQDSWYKLNNGKIEWEFDDKDISKIYLDIYHNNFLVSNLNFEPVVKSYDFSNLENGKWEFKVSLENNYSKSSSTVYKINIDNEPPQIKSFEILRDNLTYNPEFKFEIIDNFSGFNYLEIKIDNQSPIVLKDLTYKISGIEPGVHKISITAFDGAGNYTTREKEFYVKEKVEIVKNIYDIYIFIILILLIIVIIVIFEVYRLNKIKKHLRQEILSVETALNKAFKSLKRNVVKHLGYLEKVKQIRDLSYLENKILEELKKDLNEAEKLIEKEIKEDDNK